MQPSMTHPDKFEITDAELLQAQVGFALDDEKRMYDNIVGILDTSNLERRQAALILAGNISLLRVTRELGGNGNRILSQKATQAIDSATSCLFDRTDIQD